MEVGERWRGKGSLSYCDRTGERCSLTFRPSGLFGKELHKVEGYILDKRYLQHVKAQSYCFVESCVSLADSAVTKKEGAQWS